MNREIEKRLNEIERIFRYYNMIDFRGNYTFGNFGEYIKKLIKDKPLVPEAKCTCGKAATWKVVWDRPCPVPGHDNKPEPKCTCRYFEYHRVEDPNCPVHATWKVTPTPLMPLKARVHKILGHTIKLVGETWFDFCDTHPRRLIPPYPDDLALAMGAFREYPKRIGVLGRIDLFPNLKVKIWIGGSYYDYDDLTAENLCKSIVAHAERNK